MASGVKIREFRPEDYREVEEIWKETELYLPIDRRGLYLKLIRRSPHLFLVAEREGRVIGTVIGFFPYLPPSLLLEVGIGYIGHLAVRPEVQGRGIGSRLLKEICARLRSQGKSMALLGVKPWERRYKDLKRFYRERHGFKNLGMIYIKKL
ncbi:hypothetical protein DRO56_05345 [Candidatus Bathyarchaeota archaeon]|nr:MAG: hypothetical protein DRO56_05345 [Candidatus Bathyarchaeota archaeon]